MSRNGEAKKVKQRADAVLNFLHDKCVSETTLIRVFNLSRTQSYYLLRKLEKRGAVVRRRMGRLYVWCTPNSADISRVAIYADGRLQIITVDMMMKTICKLINGAKSPLISIRTRTLIQALGFPSLKRTNSIHNVVLNFLIHHGITNAIIGSKSKRKIRVAKKLCEAPRSQYI